MIELPIYIVMVWVLVNEFGIVGAAGAWTLRGNNRYFLLLGASFYSYQISPNILKDSGTKNAVIGFFILMWIAYILKVLSYPLSLVVQSLFSTLLLIVFVWAAWNYILDDIDRSVNNITH
jgi:hypothetical protein